MFLKYFPTREVDEPSRGHPTDAGIDFYMPKVDKKLCDDIEKWTNQNNKASSMYFIDEEDPSRGYISVPPNSNLLIPSGIKVEIPFGYMGLFLNKSGVASKKELLIGAQVIDTFYCGEVHIDLHNLTDLSVDLHSGEKLAQMVLVPVLCCDISMVGDEDMLYDWMRQEGHRGANGFGSTDKETLKK
jgi:dUTP pyrophosphatase